MTSETRLNIADIVGAGYGEFWRSKKRYCVVKGGRGSKKSYTTALWIIYNMMKYPLSNTLVIRKVKDTLRDSCYSQLKQAIQRLNVGHLWEEKLSPLSFTYKPSGTQILFRGLDAAEKVTSITVSKGYLCNVWLEEAYELDDESEFNKLDLSVRGQLPEGYFFRFNITLNPWNEGHWIKKRFFDNPDEDTLAITTTYKCNEYLGESIYRLFERMKKEHPRRYAVEGNGEWGISEGLVYENWEQKHFSYEQILKERPKAEVKFGLDFGYKGDASAFTAAVIDREAKEIFVFDEFYAHRQSNEQLAEEITKRGYQKEIITCDSSEPKSIDRLKALGLSRSRAAIKGPDSIRFGIRYLQEFKIYIHPKCKETFNEISNYCWKTERNGDRTNEPVDKFNHCLDALRYSLVYDIKNRNAKAVSGIAF